MSKKSGLILHPIRLRIVAELGDRQMTTSQLGQALPDVAQATLYRHIKRLLDGGIIDVINEQEVNGAVQRTYGLVARQNRFSAEEMAALTAEEYNQFFSIFSAGLIDTFSRYVNKNDPQDYAADGLSFNQAVIYLSAAEQADFQAQLLTLVQGVLSHQPEPGRRRYTLASVVIPDERK